MSRLRRKLGRDAIRTVRGFGYQWGAAGRAEAGGGRMTLGGAGSVTGRLTRSLLVGLTLLWLIGVVGSGIVLKRLIDEKSDDELQESGVILMSLVRYTDDLLVTAAVLGRERDAVASRASRTSGWSTRSATRPGRVLLRSRNAPPELLDVPLQRRASPMSTPGAW